MFSLLTNKPNLFTFDIKRLSVLFLTIFFVIHNEQILVQDIKMIFCSFLTPSKESIIFDAAGRLFKIVTILKLCHVEHV